MKILRKFSPTFEVGSSFLEKVSAWPYVSWEHVRLVYVLAVGGYVEEDGDGESVVVLVGPFEGELDLLPRGLLAAFGERGGI